jgi:hypothetical protein
MTAAVVTCKRVYSLGTVSRMGQGGKGQGIRSREGDITLHVGISFGEVSMANSTCRFLRFVLDQKGFLYLSSILLAVSICILDMSKNPSAVLPTFCYIHVGVRREGGAECVELH